MEKFQDVRIVSKNLLGMVYEIRGTKVVVKTVKGLVTADKSDLEIVESDSMNIPSGYYEQSDMTIGKTDKAVIDAFTDKKAASGNKLTTDGKRLDGNWSGGTGIAEWGTDGKIHFKDLGSKAAQQVERAVRKNAPKNWLADEDLTIPAGYSEQADAAPRDSATRKKLADIALRYVHEALDTVEVETANDTKFPSNVDVADLVRKQINWKKLSSDIEKRL